MRADARRNRERLLDAAVELILEQSGEPPRDAIAARAQVGIGTLYRHFPDQQTLLRAVALHVLDRSIAAGEEALDEATDGSEALRRYMHLAVDHGLGALNLIYRHIEDPQWPEQRERAESLLSSIVDRARSDGLMRHDVTARDIGFAIVRACRPLGVGLSLAEERTIAHRHIDIYVDGLASDTGRAPD
ncbi:MAG: TetR/AcrR family transcriptional regulator [Actinomycetota bacterium]|nr:TetR/AcrR family transcriptional regulator [Actinomycetota bacterium]